MKKAKGYRTELFGFNRQMVTASAAVSKEKDTIHLITDVDITQPRQLINEHLEKTNERLSLTGYVVSCLARTIAEFPQFNSFRKFLMILRSTFSLNERLMERMYPRQSVYKRPTKRRSGKLMTS
jgi:hypothetical protein